MRKLSVEHWVSERLDNCQRIAATKAGKDRAGWLDDAAYFAAILEALALNAEMLEALTWCVEHDGECLGDHPDRLAKASTLISDLLKSPARPRVEA